MWKNYQFTVPEKRKVRYIIHADSKNEADDQFTIAHALMTDKLDVRGIIAGHFDVGNYDRFPEHTTADASREEIDKVLDYMGLAGQYPVFTGSNLPMADEKTPIVTEAAKFIVEEAMRDDPRPLYIGMQGAITDLACAILMEPEICHRMTCIWMGGGDYPDGGQEFNLSNDVIAARVVFNSDMPLWQIPHFAYKQFGVSLAELQLKVAPCGKIGRYLFEQLVEFNSWNLMFDGWPHGEAWSLGDEGAICALMQEEGRKDLYDMVPAPYINDDMTYTHTGKNRLIRVYRTMDSRLDLEDLFAKLAINYPPQR